MADPSTWMSFMDYLGVNGDTEKELMGRDQEQADIDTETARAALQSAGSQGQQGGDMTATASYGDYLAAQRRAQASALRSTGPTSNPYEDALRGVLAPQFADRQTARDMSLANQYQQAAGRQKLGFAERKTTQDTNKALSDSIARQKKQMAFDPGQTKAAFDEEKRRNEAYYSEGGAGAKALSDAADARYWGPGGVGYGLVHKSKAVTRNAGEGRSGNLWGFDVSPGLSR